jgi:primosomal replication protein N
MHRNVKITVKLQLQDNQANIAQQAIDQGVDPAIFGDFSEKDLAAGIQKLVDHV